MGSAIHVNLLTKMIARSYIAHLHLAKTQHNVNAFKASVTHRVSANLE